MALGQEQVGRLVARAREDAGMTQPELATAIGLKHPQSISNYERGLTEVPARRLRLIADATGKPLSFFLGEVDVPDDRLTAVEGRLAGLERRLDRVLDLLGADDASAA